MDLFDRLQSALYGRYRLERELGRGGMATVYLAQDQKHERLVALKVLRPEVTPVLGAERFHREIAIAGRLQHPHILSLHDSGEAGGMLYYVMPYVEGESLRARLTQEVQLEVEDAVRIAGEVADALACAHSAGVLHRDIKPENILLTAGHAVVADFGIARALDAAGAERLTETGVVLGTPAYMSPEQASAAETLGPRSDLYALGCVLYEMLAGGPPFTGPTAQAVLARHAADPVPSLRTIRPTIPPALERVVNQALSKVPADRFRSAAEFREALTRAVLPVDIRAAGGGTAPPMTDTSKSTFRLVALRPRLVVAGALALFGAVGFLYLDRGRRPTGAVDPVASAIAVMPFVPVTEDSMLSRLGRELAVTLGANLDGVGGIRVAEPLTVLALAKEGETMTPQRGAELARRLGARSVLHGTIVRVGSDVRLDLSLSGVGENPEPLADATISGPLENVAALTDSATFAVLQEIWRGGTAPAPNLAAITTRSVPALRAYLEGELALARADFDDAVRAFERAFEADSSFWFAYWRSLYPRVYEGTQPDSATLAALLEHRHELPEADRLLIESDLAETMGEQLDLLRQTTSRFPTYWPGWYKYANFLVHWTPYLGTRNDDARDALDRTLQLNPGFAPGWEHLFWITIQQRDTTGAARAIREMERFGSTARFELNPDRLGYYRALYDLTASGGTFTEAEIEQHAQFVSRYHGPVSPTGLGLGFLGFGFPRAQVMVAHRILALGPRRELEAAMWAGLGFSYAARGGWDSALAAMDRWVRLTQDSKAALTAFGLAVTGARLASVNPRVAAMVRPRPAAGRPGPQAEERAEVAWLDGVLAHARGDPQEVDRARREIRASGSAYIDLLDGSLAAFHTDLAGRREDAARALAKLERGSAERFSHHDYGRYHPFFNAVNRLSAGPWLLAAGDTAEAARLLTWHEAVFWNVHGFLQPANETVEAVALYQRAQIETALGQTSAAGAHFREFLRRYDMPRGEWIGRVEETRAALQ